MALGEPGYPRLLAEIADPPFSLFIRGELELCSQPALGVVGTRKFTSYGQRACEEITSRLAAQGMVIISGLALGIDGIAHQATLNVGGKTVAVLGAGINRASVYPASHQSLAEKFSLKAAVWSPNIRRALPPRNILSGPQPHHCRTNLGHPGHRSAGIIRRPHSRQMRPGLQPRSFCRPPPHHFSLRRGQ